MYITISKNKLIEEAHAKIVSLETDLQQNRNENQESQTQNQLKITELSSQIEQTRYILMCILIFLFIKM